MVRKGKYQRRKTGPTYLDENNYRCKIIMHLYARDQNQSNRNIIKHTPGLSTIEGTKLDILLDKMIEDNWVKKFTSPHAKNITVFELNEKGHKVAETIKSLIENDNPLLKLPTFFEVKRVWQESS